MRVSGFQLKFAVFFAVYAISAGRRNLRVINGRAVGSLHFPYLAALEKNELQWCEGSIIARKFVLTAAHCINWINTTFIDPKILRLRVGHEVAVTGGSVYQIQKVIPHEKYNPSLSLYQYDIGLVKTLRPMEFNLRVKSIKLTRITPLEGQLAWVAGFGHRGLKTMGERTGELTAVQIPIISQEHCNELLNISDRDVICAGEMTGHKDACTGDSGAPLSVKGKLVGVVAHGFGCGRQGVPGVFTNIVNHRTWILRNLAMYNVG